MNDTVWYYVDRGGQRQGPVTAAAVAEAWRAGQANDASLAWREGMAEWTPLAGFHAELGLEGEPVSTAPAYSAPADQPPTSPPPAAALPTPPKSNKGCLIAGLVGGGLFLLFVVGILVAIALPAYQEYVERAKAMADDPASAEIPADDGTTPDGSADTSGLLESGILAMALAEARQHQGLVDDFVANTDRCPRDGTEVAVPQAITPGVVAITVGEARTGMCTIEVELGGSGAESLAGEGLTLSRDVAGDWYCTSDLARRDVLPEECR